jgi:hypothetical protein
MTELGLQGLLGTVNEEDLSRRHIMRQLTALGLCAPFVTMLLSRTGRAQPIPHFASKPTAASGGRVLKMYFW